MFISEQNVDPLSVVELLYVRSLCWPYPWRAFFVSTFVSLGTKQRCNSSKSSSTMLKSDLLLGGRLSFLQCGHLEDLAISNVNSLLPSLQPHTCIQQFKLHDQIFVLCTDLLQYNNGPERIDNGRVCICAQLSHYWVPDQLFTIVNVGLEWIYGTVRAWFVNR